MLRRRVCLLAPSRARATALASPSLFTRSNQKQSEAIRSNQKPLRVSPPAVGPPLAARASAARVRPPRPQLQDLSVRSGGGKAESVRLYSSEASRPSTWWKAMEGEWKATEGEWKATEGEWKASGG